MIKKFKGISPHLMVGVIAGFLIALFIKSEGSFLIWSSEFQQLDINVVVLHWIINIGAITSFLFIITLSNSKWFRSVNLNKLSIYFLFSILASIVSSFIFMNLVGGIIEGLYLEVPIDIFKINIAAIILLMSIVLVFVVTFVLLINRKVKYIKFLTKEVKTIKEEGFGKTIKVKGKDELAELCTSINNMSIELAEKVENEKRIENTKAELITNISHDLKTPLTSIVGYLELLNKDQADEETKKKYISIAYNKSLRLKDLVNELFEYTKLTSHDFKINSERLNLVNLINQMVGESILGFSAKNIEVILDNPYREIYTYIDINLFSRVIDNLIKNAEKYSEENSVFKVKVRSIENSILMTFTNKCKDLKEESLDKIFEKFYRVDEARALENDGSGLGLSIAKRIIDLHGGSLTAEKKGDFIEFKIKLNSQ